MESVCQNCALLLSLASAGLLPLEIAAVHVTWCVLLMKAQDCFTVRNTTKGGRGCFQSRIVCLDFPGSSVVLAGYFAATAQLHCLLLFCYGLALPGYEGSSVEPQLQIYDTSVLQVTKIKLWKKLGLAKCSRVCPIYCGQIFFKKSL